MAIFYYKAKTSSGNIVTGTFDASDKAMVLNLLRSKGYFPIDVKDNSGAKRNITFESFKKVKTKELAIFCRQFYTMINAGVSIIGCLDMLRKQTENSKLASVINKVYDDVQKGKTLSESMSAHRDVFPVLLTSMIEVGEVSGSLDAILGKLALNFEKDNKIKQKIKTAMMYPAAIGSIAFIVVLFMLTFIVPRFVDMFKSFGNGVLPLPTRILLAISNTLKNPVFDLGAIVFIILLVYLFSKFKRTDKGKYILDNIILRLPLVGKNVRKILASRFTRTLSSMLSSAVPLLHALEVTEKVVNNALVTKGLERVKEDIKRGSNLAGPLESMGIFPVMVPQMVSVGEESGSIDSIMETIANFYDEELDNSISQLIAILEPVMMMLLAVVIGAIVVSMVLPIFSMYGNIGQ